MSGILGQTITDARFGDDEFRARRVGFNFFAQVRHVNTQIVGVLVVALSPDFAKDLAVGEDFSCVAHQEPKKLVFRDTEFHFTTVHSDATSRQVHYQFSRLEYDRFLVFRRMAQSHADSREKFARIERFGHIVISTIIKGRDFTGFIVLNGEDQDRCVAPLAQPAQYFLTWYIRQAKVEDYQR